ncbi:MAG: aminomethyl-transferring glycine dehydrogenase subunit GcvPA, partial [Alphaproteobacteria bacterium]
GFVSFPSQRKASALHKWFHHQANWEVAMIQRGEFLTSYTPYQPEVSQGTLQYLFEFQTQVALLTGMEVANASMYDGATATAEAVLMACRLTGRNRVILSGGLHPHYREVASTLARTAGITVDSLSPDPIGIEDLLGRVGQDIACVVVQNPGFFGHLKDQAALAATCHDFGALLVVAVTDPVSLGLVRSPGDMGADIVVGDGQGLAGAMNFGGPGLGLFATRERFVRQMPGRLVGETVDQDGRRGFVLTLATREQHIRREKATSNICTNAGLLALSFSIHLALLGEVGLARLAEMNHVAAMALAERLSGVRGVRIIPRTYFNEFSLQLPRPATVVAKGLAARGILGGVPAARFYPDYPELENVLLVAATETNTLAEMDGLVQALEDIL